MSEPEKPPDGPAKSARPVAKPAARAVPSTGASSSNLRVMSAARRQPPVSSERLVDRLKGGAEDKALNGFAVLRETWVDFRRADRFFKYKALIIGIWLVLMSGTFVVACPRAELNANNGLGARLVIAGDASRPVCMIVNDSEKTWAKVTVIVNSEYETAADQVEPHGNLTVTPRLLVGSNGAFAPRDMHIVTLEIRTSRGQTVLMKGGEVR